MRVVSAHFDLTGIRDLFNKLKIPLELSSDIHSIMKAELVVFMGGEDVFPLLYGNIFHPLTISNLDRDMIEMTYYQIAKRFNKKMFGICRGHQFLNVMEGGILKQDLYHPTLHALDNSSCSFNSVNSHHHQGVIDTPLLIKATYTDIIEVTKSIDDKIFSLQAHPEYSNFPLFNNFAKDFRYFINDC